MKPRFRGKSLFYFCLLACLAIVAVHLLTITRLASWEDEVFAFSTGWSIAHAKTPALSVLALFPDTISPVRFYGPVSFETAAVLIRIFGFSPTAWRVACFSGVILTTLVSALLVRLAGGDRWATLLAVLVSCFGGVVESNMPGRFDFVAMGILLLGMLLSLSAFQPWATHRVLKTILAGSFVGLALACTPRILTPLTAFSAAAVLAALIFGGVRQGGLKVLSGTLLTAFVVHNVILKPWGMNSFSWLRFVRRCASSDPINASPLTGLGHWSLDLQYYKTFFSLGVFLVLLGATAAWVAQRGGSGEGGSSVRMLLTIFSLVNLCLMILLLTHPFGLVPYWLPPILVAALSWFDWERLRSTSWEKIAAVALALACVLPLVFRASQQAACRLISWRQLSTSRLTDLLRYNLPPGSNVFGPVGGYFYPVTLAGDTYLYAWEQTTPGLYSKPRAAISSTIYKATCGRQAFIIWPEPDNGPELGSMPAELSSNVARKVGEIVRPPVSARRDFLLRHLGPIPDKYGYPNIGIWQLRSRGQCGANLE